MDHSDHVPASGCRANDRHAHGCGNRQGLCGGSFANASAFALPRLPWLALLIGNVATTFSEFAGIASGMEMFGVPRWVSVPIAAAAVWGLIVGGSFKRVQRVFMVLSFVFVTYIVAAIIAQPNWNLALMHTVIPEVSSDFSVSFAHGCHGRHHHRSLDDVLRTEQRGREGRDRKGSLLPAHRCDHGAQWLPASSPGSSS